MLDEEFDDEPDFDPTLEFLRHTLETLYRGRLKIEREGATYSGSLFYLWNVLKFAKSLMGDAAYDLVMREPGSAPDLLLLAHRLQAIGPFMDGKWPESFTYEQFAEEIYAIAGGDAPRILSQTNKRKGKSGNAFRIATHKLQALIWQRVLRKRGYPAGESDEIVSSAFSNVPAATMAKWETECRGKLGDREVDRQFEWGETIDRKVWGEPLTDAEIRKAVAEAGAKYSAERKATIPAKPAR